MIKTRFAPSPTGFLHIGSLRTALYAYLFAKKNAGHFVLRVEDTDRERFVEGAFENIIHTLHWAGLDIDEGVDMDKQGNIIQKGDNGPYIQSERLNMYIKEINALIENGHAYYAFDTKEELDAMRQQQETQKLPTIYDREHMKNQFTLGDVETKQLLERGVEYVVRMNIPHEGNTIFSDLIRGEISFENRLIDDQVLLKADGFPTYHLANVVDDHMMGISHVIRGEEWLSSTPKHILLYEFFGWKKPVFAHLSLLVNEQKQKLSKRHGDVAVEDFKEKGYLPEAMINFLAFLGWNPGDEREIFSLSDLEQVFDFDNVSKSSAVFNREKLDWYNREYIKTIDIAILTERTKPFFINQGLLTSEMWNVEKMKSVVALEQGRANTLHELVNNVSFIFINTLEYDAELLIWKKSTAEDALEKLSAIYTYFETIDEKDWNKEKLNDMTIAWIAQHGWSNGDVLWPTRVALSGLKNSPGPLDIASVLGKEQTLKRIKQAVEKY